MDLLALFFFSPHALADLGAATGPRFYLVREGQPACTLVSRGETELQRRAARAVVEGVREVSGVELPVRAGPGGPSAWALVREGEPQPLDGSALERLGEEGFGFRRQGDALSLLARTDRAAYYGSVYLRDTLLRVEGRDVFLDTFPELVPPLRVRGTYHLACWGRSPEYRQEDWQVVLDAMAEDGMNTVYFWLSGLFRSQRHPEAFTYPQTAMTTEDVRDLIRYAHTLGLKFYLGAGVFAWLGIDALAEAYPETKAVGSGGMCPSHPRARELNQDYLLEMFDTFPEADGLFLEVRDEYGACLCERCQAVDGGGVRHYGQAELSFLEELSEAVWTRKPTAELVWCIGYSEGGSHADDAGYYARLRELADPRRHWLVVRGNWELPDLDGRMHPLTHFAREMIHWTHYYEDPLDDLRGWIERSVHEGLLGYCPAFEPGFSSASFYSDDIPFPVNALPYVLTRFAYRTFTWEPHLGQAQGQPLLQFRERVRRKFFTPDAPPELTDDLLWLFDFIRTTATSTAFRPGGRWQRGERRAWLKEVETATEARAHSPDEWEQMAQWLAALLELGAAHASRLDEIAGRIEAHGPAASARTKRSLKMLRQAVTDCRTELLLRPEDATRLRAAAEKCVRLREELVGRGVRVSATSCWRNAPTYSPWKVLDGRRETSWLAADSAPLPQTLTLEFADPRPISRLRLVQGTYHEAYNTRAYRVEVSTDGTTFEPVAEGELANERGDERTHEFAPIPVRAVRLVITSVYPNVAYSAPSLAEVGVE